METERRDWDGPLAPLHVLTGAPGAGKTTVLPALVRLGNGVRGGHGRGIRPRYDSRRDA